MDYAGKKGEESAHPTPSREMRQSVAPVGIHWGFVGVRGLHFDEFCMCVGLRTKLGFVARGGFVVAVVDFMQVGP